MTPTQRGRKVAVIDGVGEHAEVYLCVEYPDGTTEDISWPKNWPEYASYEFLRGQGYKVIRA